MDFSPAAQAGLAAAMALGRRWGARLRLIHADDSPASFYEELRGAQGVRGEADRARGLEERLAALAREFPGAEVRVACGEPLGALAAAAAEEGVDLVAMGTRARRGWRAWAGASAAESLARGCAVPVLAVKAPPAANWPSRILAPVKFIEYAGRALAWAIELADSAGASITVLHVAEAGEPRPESLTAFREHIERVLGPARAARTRLIQGFGDPVTRIVDEARRGLYDAVVLSAHERSPSPPWRVSTTAQKVLRLAPTPVFCVPAPESLALRPAGAAALSLLQAGARPRPAGRMPPRWVGDKLY